jgi:hypothetical protein
MIPRFVFFVFFVVPFAGSPSLNGHKIDHEKHEKVHLPRP